jgi:hypothetical protein
VASPNPAPGNFISAESNNAPHLFPSIILGTPTGPALTPNGAAVDVPALSIGGSPMPGAPVSTPVTAGGALAAGQGGGLFELNLLASFVLTLPAANAVVPNVTWTFVVKVAPTSGNGYEVDPIGTDVMRGNGFTPAAAKGARNTQATARIGDCLDLVSNGVDAWYIVGVIGTWARTP